MTLSLFTILLCWICLTLGCTPPAVISKLQGSGTKAKSWHAVDFFHGTKDKVANMWPVGPLSARFLLLRWGTSLSIDGDNLRMVSAQ